MLPGSDTCSPSCKRAYLAGIHAESQNMACWTNRDAAFGGSDIQCKDSTTCVQRASVSASQSGRELAFA